MMGGLYRRSDRVIWKLIASNVMRDCQALWIGCRLGSKVYEAWERSWFIVMFERWNLVWAYDQR